MVIDVYQTISNWVICTFSRKRLMSKRNLQLFPATPHLAPFAMEEPEALSGPRNENKISYRSFGPLFEAHTSNPYVQDDGFAQITLVPRLLDITARNTSHSSDE